MKNIKIKTLMLGTLAMFLFLGLFPYQTNAQTPVTGNNVTEFTIERYVGYMEQSALPAKFSVKLTDKEKKQWDFEGIGPCTEGNRSGFKYDNKIQMFCSFYVKGAYKYNTVITFDLVTKSVYHLYNGNRDRIIFGKIINSGKNFVGLAGGDVGTAKLEQQCFDAIQGKVAWNKAGTKDWGASAIVKLCAKTTNPTNTIACFKKEIQKHNSYQRGIEACRVGGKPVANDIIRSYSGKAKISRFTVTQNNRPTPILRSAANSKTTLRNVAYGISVKTWNPTISPPEVQIYGTKGKSNILILDNKVDNLNKNGSDYYIFSGLELKDIGVPIVIAFKPTSKDGWGFEGVEVDYYEGKSSTWSADQSVRSIKDSNNREVARRALLGQADIYKIDFPGRRGLDADEGVDQNIKHEKVVAIIAEGSELNPIDPNSADSTGRDPIRLQTDFEIIDTRFSLAGEFKSSQIRRLTQEDILAAVDTFAIENNFSNTTSIGVSLETELSLFGQSVSTTFSVDNETTVAENQTNTNQESSSNRGVEFSESGKVQTYKVPKGNFFLIDITYSTAVERYTDFAGLIRIKPVQSVTATITGVNYRVECWSGELRRVETLTGEDFQDVTQFGPYLKDQKDILDKIKKQLPNFTTKTTPGKNCYRPAF